MEKKCPYCGAYVNINISNPLKQKTKIVTCPKCKKKVTIFVCDNCLSFIYRSEKIYVRKFKKERCKYCLLDEERNDYNQKQTQENKL